MGDETCQDCCEHGILLDDHCAACKADAENDARYDAMKEGD